MSRSGDEGFLQRWAQRKARVQRGVTEAEAVPTQVAPQPVAPPVVPTVAESVPAAPDPATAPRPASEPVEAPPPPTMQDVARLTRSSDYSRFVGAGVDRDVSNAAMRKLFSDPAFNVMDGLDTYIDDYGKPDPIPESMLRQLNQSKVLRLFEIEDDAAKAPGDAAAAAASTDGVASPTVAESFISSPVPPPGTDDDPDLRLQQDDAPGRPGPAPGSRA